MSDRPLQATQDSLRIPLYGEENPHGFNDNSIGLDQMFINMIPTFSVDQNTQTKSSLLVKRPGIIQLSGLDWMTGIVNDKAQCTILDAIPITAVYDVFVVAVFDASNSTIYIIQIRPNAGTSTKIGSFTPTASVDDFCFLSEYSQSSAGSLFPAVAVSWTNKALTASKGYWAKTTAGVFTAASLTEITDTGFPAKQTPALITTGRFVALNATLYIATLDGRIYNSVAANNDAATWTDTNSQIGFLSTNMYPDQCIGIERYKHHIVAFGRNSIEFFNDVGTTPCPLQPTQQAFIKFGAKSPRTIRNVNDVLYWIAYGNDGASGLWMLNGYTPSKLSSDQIDFTLTGINNGGDPSFYNLQATSINNIPHLIINGITIVSPICQSYPGTVPVNATDTYTLNVVNDCSVGSLCYNIRDRTWWFTNNSAGLICAGTEFSTPAVSSAANYYCQILFYSQVGANLSQNYVYTWNFISSSIFNNYDDFPDLLDTRYPNQPITSVVQMNTMWFGNEKRKRINKFKVIGYIPRNNTDSNVYSYYLFYLKDQDSLLSGTGLPNLHLRSFVFPNSFFRYYINNLGMGRAWSFCLVEKSKQPLTLKAIELDIQQGSH